MESETLHLVRNVCIFNWVDAAETAADKKQRTMKQRQKE